MTMVLCTFKFSILKKDDFVEDHPQQLHFYGHSTSQMGPMKRPTRLRETSPELPVDCVEPF